MMDRFPLFILLCKTNDVESYLNMISKILKTRLLNLLLFSSTYMELKFCKNHNNDDNIILRWNFGEKLRGNIFTPGRIKVNS